MTVLRHPNNQGVTLSQWRKTAAGGETSLSGTDDFSAGLAYTAGAEQVFVNGVLLERGVDYTASTGTTVTGLTALVAGDIVTVSSPSAFNVANTVPLSTYTAKGDVAVGTGASTVGTLSVGADGTTLVADSSTSTGLRYQATMAGAKNAVINGGFDIWQRGTSFTTLANYIADRWYWGGSGTGRTISRQTGTAGCQYAIRMQRDSGNTSTNPIAIGTSMEIAQATPLQGSTITLSFYAKAGANYSASSNQMVVQISTGTSSTETNRMTTAYASGDATPLNSTATLTTSWQRFSYNVTLASNVTQFLVYLQSGCVGTAGAADYVDITGVQVEVGSVATQFTRSGGTLQGELAACQRYYYLVGAGANKPLGSSLNESTTLTYVDVYAPVTMRTAPTIVQTTGASYYLIAGSNQSGFTGIDQSTNTITELYLSTSGLTQGQARLCRSQNASGSISLSAEL